MSDICIILIRSGSKGIKNKNIKIVKGYPLIYYTLKSVLSSEIFKKVIISSDKKYYFKVIRKYFPNKQKYLDFFLRSNKYAKDTSSSEESLLEILKTKSFLKREYKTVYFVQATSPMLKANDLISARKKFKRGKYDSMLSGYKEKIFFWKPLSKFNFKSINYDYKNRPRRQNFKNVYFENGAFYIFNLNLFFKFKNRLFKRIGFFEMPKYRSFEIDDFKDLNFIKKILK